MSLLVTGGCGFIGTNFIHHMLSNKLVDHIVNVDLLTYAGNKANLVRYRDDPRYEFRQIDIRNVDLLKALFFRYGIKQVVHFAAETHVDRSIAGAEKFISTNVGGTETLLRVAERFNVSKFVQVSTDEVYGSLSDKWRSFTEFASLYPSSPYSASKAGAEHIAMAYHRTHGAPVVVTRCVNNYGPYQHVEKLIPLFVTNLIKGMNVPLYGEGTNIREWIHVLDHCKAIHAVLNRGVPGNVYNIGSGMELPNHELTSLILEWSGVGNDRVDYVMDRPGHDFRYAVASSKARNELEWEPVSSNEDTMKETFRWYKDNEDWWRGK